jgi:uncharacterized membrane protein SpoIIM required for sporulation
MVLEQLFKLNWIERKEHAILIGVIYAIIGIFSAYLIIPSYAGLMSIAFTSILLIPSLNQLLLIEENQEIREKKISLVLLLKDHLDIIKIYLFLFMGIFITYFALSLLLNLDFGSRIFEAQLYLTGVVGHATKNEAFIRILFNNIIVFAVCFILSLIYGAGSILFLTINASTWGAFFGHLLKQAMMNGEGSKITAFFSYILPILPHTVTEALAYIFAAIVGGIVSKATIREKPFSKKFNHIITDAFMMIGLGIIIVIIAGILEVYVF